MADIFSRTGKAGITWFFLKKKLEKLQAIFKGTLIKIRKYPYRFLFI